MTNRVRGEGDVGGITLAALEVAAAEVAFSFHMPDHRFDGGAASQLALDHTEDPALLVGDEDTARIGGVIAAIVFVDSRARSRNQ